MRERRGQARRALKAWSPLGEGAHVCVQFLKVQPPYERHRER